MIRNEKTVMSRIPCAHCGLRLDIDQHRGLPDHETRADQTHIHHDAACPSYSLRCECQHYTMNIADTRL